jgi:hypothetical protein
LQNELISAHAFTGNATVAGAVAGGGCVAFQETERACIIAHSCTTLRRISTVYSGGESRPLQKQNIAACFAGAVDIDTRTCELKETNKTITKNSTGHRIGAQNVWKTMN